jgi:hypothetical protein
MTYQRTKHLAGVTAKSGLLRRLGRVGIQTVNTTAVPPAGCGGLSALTSSVTQPIEAAPAANLAVGGLTACRETADKPRQVRARAGRGPSGTVCPLIMRDWAKGESVVAVCLVDCLEMRGLCSGYGDHAKIFQ